MPLRRFLHRVFKAVVLASDDPQELPHEAVMVPCRDEDRVGRTPRPLVHVWTVHHLYVQVFIQSCRRCHASERRAARWLSGEVTCGGLVNRTRQNTFTIRSMIFRGIMTGSNWGGSFFSTLDRRTATTTAEGQTASGPPEAFPDSLRIGKIQQNYLLQHRYRAMRLILDSPTRWIDSSRDRWACNCWRCLGG